MSTAFSTVVYFGPSYDSTAGGLFMAVLDFSYVPVISAEEIQEAHARVSAMYPQTLAA